MIQEVDWKKYARYVAPKGRTLCPICDKPIEQGESGVTYSKTRGGTHLFLHIKCVQKMENGKVEVE